MAFRQDDDYNTVAERIVEFRTKYPEGTIQPLNRDKPYELLQMGNTLVFIVVAAAYRTPDDPRPGVGMAYEPIPGSTPFTRGSELQNAETAAWGRALIAVGAADAKKGIATREEVMNSRERQANPPLSHQYGDPPTTAAVRPDTGLAAEAERTAALHKLSADINTLSQADRAEYQASWREAKLPKLGDLNSDQFKTARGMLDILLADIANRSLAQIALEDDPAASPDYDAPDSDYYSEEGQ